MAVGIKQKKNVDAIVNKVSQHLFPVEHFQCWIIFVSFLCIQFSSENFTVILFHYDGNVNDWHDFGWSDSAIHVVANHQTKW